MRLVESVGRPHPLVLAIIATIGAAALVLYLQHRAITTLQSQNAGDRPPAVRADRGRTSPRVATHARRPGLRHADGRQSPRPARRPPRPGRAAFQRGPRSLSRTSTGSSPGARDDRRGRRQRRGAVLRARAADSRRDPALGRAVVDAGAPACRYAADLHRRRGCRRRPAAPGLPAPVLDRRAAPRLLRGARFRHRSGQPCAQRLFDRAGRGNGSTRSCRGGAATSPLQLRVTDEHGAARLRRRCRPRPTGRGSRFPMLFYPAEDIRSRLAAGVAPRPWTIEVGAPGLADVGAGTGQSYWPTVLSVVLMLVALGLTVQAHRRSAELARMQTDFVAHVSHQLKTPLSLLSAATETLQMDRIRSPEKLVEYLGHDSRRGAAPVDARPARARVLARAAGAQLRVRTRRPRRARPRDRRRVRAWPVEPAGRLRRAPARARARTCAADPAALEQVVANLLDNAVKYSSAGQPVTVTRRRRAPPGGHRRSTTAASASPAADQARIFERFYRVPWRRRTRPGFGLGLPIVRELVHAHGGRVEVSSAPGRRQHVPGDPAAASPEPHRRDRRVLGRRRRWRS